MNVKSSAWQNLYTCLKPTLILSECFGLITFSISKNTTERKSKLKCYRNLLLTLTYIPLGIYVLIRRFSLTEAIIYKTTDIIILIIGLIYASTTWINAIVQQKTHLQFLKEITLYDTEFLALGYYKIDYKKSSRKFGWVVLVRCFLTVIVVISTVVTYWLWTNTTEIYLIFFVYSIPALIEPAVFVQTITYTDLLKTRLVLLNLHLRSLTTNQETVGYLKNHRQVVVNTICGLHHHLTKIIKLFNMAFGINLLATFGLSFINIVMGLYYFSNALTSLNIRWLLVVNTLFSSGLNFADTVGICQVCKSTIEEVKQTGVLIHKIDDKDEEMRDEIEMFSLQIANEQVEFNAAGFFPINFTLLFSIVGGVTTYIIILIQLSN